MGWEGPITHRQFLAWTSWRKRQWNNPSLTEHYLMQCAAASLWAAGSKVEMEKMRLRFGEERVRSGNHPSPQERAQGYGLTKEQVDYYNAKIVQAQRMRAMGVKRKNPPQVTPRRPGQ